MQGTPTPALCCCAPPAAQLRKQHLVNLTALMRAYALQRNLPRLAAVAALLLGLQVGSGGRAPVAGQCRTRAPAIMFAVVLASSSGGRGQACVQAACVHFL